MERSESQSYSHAWFVAGEGISNFAIGVDGKSVQTYFNNSSAGDIAFYISKETENAMPYNEAAEILEDGGVIQIETELPVNFDEKLAKAQEIYQQNIDLLGGKDGTRYSKTQFVKFMNSAKRVAALEKHLPSSKRTIRVQEIRGKNDHANFFHSDIVRDYHGLGAFMKAGFQDTHGVIAVYDWVDGEIQSREEKMAQISSEQENKPKSYEYFNYKFNHYKLEDLYMWREQSISYSQKAFIMREINSLRTAREHVLDEREYQ
jgi:hypothetical protein